MMRALYSSVAGLKTHQTKMDVIGNNISNVNTVGFKSSRVTFSTMMYQSMSNASGANAEMGTGGINAKQIGLGTNFASTAVNIATGGAAESTGGAFDLKISDTNSTSFYIVNNGSENVFTRAGAFYVDGAGNLCMESTGYTVMGWQVDANGNIQKDTVSPLRIMTPTNQTSNPEWTTQAVCKGILDDNNANVNSDTGYKMNLNFFDNLGYPYTGRFAVQKGDEDGYYTVNLIDILDQNGNSIFDDDDVERELNSFFGSSIDPQGSQVDITDNYTMASGKSGQLKRLAVGSGFKLGYVTTYPTASADDPFILTFSASDVNEYFGASLPDGVIVRLVYKSNDANDKPEVEILDSREASYTQKLDDKVDAKDTEVPKWYNNGSDQLKADELLIYKKETLSDIISEMGLTDGEVLDNSYIQQIRKKFDQLDASDPPLTGESYTAVYDATNDTWALQDSTGNAITVTPATKLEKEYKLDDDAFLKKAYVTIKGTDVNKTDIFTTKLPGDVEIRYPVTGGGSYTIVTPRSDGFNLKFSTVDGSLEYVGQPGSTSQILQLGGYDDEANKFTNITIDFSTLKNLANGKSCTAAIANGDLESEGTGKKVGAMTGLTVDQSGKIYGTYDNGNRQLLGQIAVARFANASGLESIGNNCFKTTLNSGDFDGIGVEIDADGSKISTGELEMSNVDLATEFTQMITTQRGYQANSRVISTSDSILEELVNLKR